MRLLLDCNVVKPPLISDRKELEREENHYGGLLNLPEVNFAKYIWMALLI
jgi:hypothetical protein